MANDASNQPTTLDHDMSSTGMGESEIVQIAETAAANPPAGGAPAAGGTVKVEIPQGATTVRVPVQPGQVVILPEPFDSAHALGAKEGNGNLAIKVGDVTVILQGYVEAANDPQHPVVIDGHDGKPIDIAVVLATTDPNLNIETAAGPTAEGPQGADNTGAILSQFGPGNGLGGLNAVGVLDQTALQYKLIDNAIRQELGDQQNGTNPPPGLIITPGSFVAGNEAFLGDPNITIKQFANHLTFNDFANGFTDTDGVQHNGFENKYADFPGSQSAPGDISGVTGYNLFTIDTKNDATVSCELTLTGLQGQNLTSNGVALHYVLSEDGTTIFAFRGDGSEGTDGALVFVLHVIEKGAEGSVHTFEVDSFLANRIDDLDSNGNPVNFEDIKVTFDVSTSADQTGSGTIDVHFTDDNPIAHDDTATVGNQAGITVDAANGVEGNDNFGADGKVSGGGVIGVVAGKDAGASASGTDTDIHGQFGTLHLNADGSYTYTRDSTDPTNGEQDDYFTYTIKDGDKDTTTANLKIVINDHPVTVTPPPPPQTGDNPVELNKSGTAVFESGLPTGSKPDDNTETTSGTVKITAPDGVQTIEIDGKTIDLTGKSTTITGTYGDITVTYDSSKNEIDYTYTLKDHDPNHSTQGNDIIPGEDFKITVTDSDGDKGNGDINISIVDDVPTAVNDTDTVGSKAGSQTLGNVITGVGDASSSLHADTFGADGKTASGGLTAVTGTGATSGDVTSGFDVVGKYGTLHINADGSYTYTVGKDGLQFGQTDSFTYTITDGDGDTSTATLVIDAQTKPDITQLTPGAHPGEVDVYEAGLSDGSKDGPTDTTATGTFQIDSHGEGFQSLTIGGVKIDLTQENQNTVISSDGTGTMTVTGVHNDGNGAYTITYSYTLADNILDNTVGQDGHNAVTLPTYTIVAKDTSGDEATDTLTVKVVDDIPVTSSGTEFVQTTAEKNNVLLIIDATGSMNTPYPDSSSAQNKLQFQVAACINLLNSYLAAGGGDPNNLRVQIETFHTIDTNGTNTADGTQVLTTQWVSITEALSILLQLEGVTPSGHTNYDAAIQAAMNGIDWSTSAGALSGATNSAYFFSDGNPNVSTNPGDSQDGLNGTQLQQWISYLTANGVNAYAVGLGVDPNTPQSAEIDAVAYDGATKTDTGAILVSQPDALDAAVLATIPIGSTGDLVGQLGGKFGADGGHVNSITIDGVTYTASADLASIAATGGASNGSYDATTHVLTITVAGGTIAIDLDTGAYTYHADMGSAGNLNVGFTLIDNDGDISNGSTLHLLRPVPVVTLAADPVVAGLVDAPAQPTSAGHNVVAGGDANANTLNGTDGNDYIDGQGGKDTMTGGKGDDVYVVSQTNDVVVEASNAGIDTVLASDDYTLAANVENLYLTGAANISGQGNELDNVIVGNSGNNYIDGKDGNDHLYGAAGADTLFGGAGNDYIDGGTGADEMHGGAGNDVYVVDNAGDKVYESGNEGTDTVISSLSTYTLGGNVENLVLANGGVEGIGNAFNNTMVGNAANNHLDGGLGNDILVGGGGSDKMQGGAGDDQFLHVDAKDLDGTNTLDGTHTIDGGSGNDLVDLSDLGSLNATQASRIENVEVLSFTGGSGTSVSLDYNAVLSMTDDHNTLVIHGDAGSDSVNLAGNGANSWTQIASNVTGNDGGHYDVFQAGTGTNVVTVLVDHNLAATVA
jgi:VCBS repeat-containing protein